VHRKKASSRPKHVIMESAYDWGKHYHNKTNSLAGMNFRNDDNQLCFVGFRTAITTAPRYEHVI
jgi:hypothetical protein